jgi:uroporphyrinogen III methyltransferase/synthase
MGRRKTLLDWLQKRKIDYITFTSSSTVRNFFEPLPRPLRKSLRARLISIGPVTSKTLREYGLKPTREARVHTTEGLVEILCNGR